MKVGNLVKITRASIGIPEGTLALVIEYVPARAESNPDLMYYIVQLVGLGHRPTRRYLPQDLEMVS